MEKNEIVEFLKERLREIIKKYYSNEVTYRTLTSMTMQKPNDKKVLEMQTSSLQGKDAYKIEIKQLRGVISELEKGTLEVV